MKYLKLIFGSTIFIVVVVLTDIKLISGMRKIDHLLMNLLIGQKYNEERNVALFEAAVLFRERSVTKLNTAAREISKIGIV